jgi:deoxyribodipyrimidine photolyase-like uncharacterized protein
VSGSSWRAWLAAAAIFVLGVGVGGAGMAWAGIRVFRHALQNPGATRGFAERATERVGADLTKALKLTPEESAQVQTILAQTATNLKSVRLQAATQVSTEVRATVQRIAATLPREKRVEFYRLVARRYERLGLPAPQPDQDP